MKRIAATFVAPILALLLGSPAMGADVATGRVDINAATKDELKTTLGVDDAEAARIIEARPYYKKDDLKEKGVLSAGEFEKLQRLIESVC